jgi:peptidoglycan/LPS O-acetylase OafA/YrhL
MLKTGIEPYLWRGALGGAIGVLIGIGLLAVYSVSAGLNNLLPQLIAAGLSIGLAGGALAGGIIGAIIFRVAAKKGRDPQAQVRVLIGVGSILVFSLLVNLLSGRRESFLLTLAYALVIGALPGLLARSKNPEELSEGEAVDFSQDSV